MLTLVTLPSPPIVVPDRYESLARRAGDAIKSIVEPVQQALGRIDDMFARMERADRGAFLIMRGASGAGKSTFLHTLHFYRDGVKTVSVPGGASIREFLQSHVTTAKDIELLVLEECEASINFTDKELEDWLYSINGYIRSERGRKSVIVWPCNSDELLNRLVCLAETIGSDSLLGTADKWLLFSGPEKARYLSIADRTLSTLNQGANFPDLGLTVETVSCVAVESATIGNLLTRLHDAISAAEGEVRRLCSKEQCRLWILVAAGTDPEAEVAGLTRGRQAAIDTERLMSATGANVVVELKKYPQEIGVLGSVLDAKIMHLPVLAASSIARAYADDALQQLMSKKNLALKPADPTDAAERLSESDLGRLLSAGTQGTLTRGKKVGSSSVEAFGKLAEIATSNDAALNRAIGRALVAAKLIISFEVEQDFGNGLKRRTDILAQTANTRTHLT